MHMGKFTRRRIVACIQIIVSISLIGWIFIKIDLEDTLKHLMAVSVMELISCKMALAFLVIPAAIRWRWFVMKFMPEGMAPPGCHIHYEVQQGPLDEKPDRAQGQDALAMFQELASVSVHNAKRQSEALHRREPNLRLRERALGPVAMSWGRRHVARGAPQVG